MVNNLECYKTRLLLKRDQIKNTIGTVYVKYNVPKAIRGLGVDGRAKSFTAPARFSKISQVSKTIRTKYEHKNQVVATVENHQLKGLGVGKCYSEYHSPPTAPEQLQQRQGFTPSTPSRAGQRQSIIHSPNNQVQSASQTRQQPPMPSHGPISQDRTNLKHAQANTIKHITNIYNARQKSMIRDKDIENKTVYLNGQHHPTYLHSPMFYAQKHHLGNLELKDQGHHSKADDQGHYQNDRGQGYQHKDGQGHHCNSDGHDDPGYAAYQNVKNNHSGHLKVYNNSSSTPTVPYSTADILYGSELNGNRVPQNDDVRQNSFGDSERSRDSARQKSKELEQSANNRRPSSKSGKQKSLTIDSVAPFDKDREDPLKSLSSTLPPAKPSHHFRPNGIRSNIVKPDILFCPKPNGAVTGRDQDDLVAMGTLWSPNNNPAQPPPPVAFSSTLIAQQQQQQQSGSRNNSVSNGNTNIFPSKAVSANSVNQSMSSTNNTLNTQRKYPGNNIRPIVVQNNVPGKKVSNSMKEQEDPKYTDPMFGAPASFQQRIIELGALEGDTVRWERSKRLKKKKQDRDS